MLATINDHLPLTHRFQYLRKGHLKTLTAEAGAADMNYISAGSSHICIIDRNDGSLKCTGENSEYSQAPLQAVANGAFSHVSSGMFHTCAVVEDKGEVDDPGFIKCWGKNDVGQAPVSKTPTGYTGYTTGYKHVAVGPGGHTCAILHYGAASEEMTRSPDFPSTGFAEEEEGGGSSSIASPLREEGGSSSTASPLALSGLLHGTAVSEANDDDEYDDDTGHMLEENSENVSATAAAAAVVVGPTTTTTMSPPKSIQRVSTSQKSRKLKSSFKSGSKRQSSASHVSPEPSRV